MFKQSTSVSGPQKIGAVCQMVDWACLSFQDTDKIRFEMNNKTKIHMPPLHVIIIFSEKRAFMGTFGKKSLFYPFE